MVDADRIEERCRTFVRLSGTVNYAVYGGDPSVIHVWHGADTACRMILGSKNFDDFEIGLSHRNVKICPYCTNADPNYKHRAEVYKKRSDQRKVVAVLATVLAFVGLTVGFWSLWDVVVGELLISPYPYVYPVPTRAQEIDAATFGNYYLVALAGFLSYLVYHLVLTGRIHGYLTKYQIRHTHYWIYGLLILMVVETVLLRTVLPFFIQISATFAAAIVVYAVFYRRLERFKQQ